MLWYFPSHNGDVRIAVDPEDPRQTIVTVIEPTANELEMLDAANNVFRAKKWVHQSSKLWKLGGDQARQETKVSATLLEVGLILIGRLKPGIATLTAVTTEEGHVEAMGSAESGFLAWIGKALHGDVGAMPSMVNMRDQEGYAKLQMAKRKEAQRRAVDEELLAAEKKRREEEEATKKTEAAAKKSEAPTKKAKAATSAAATVKRPTACCPQSVSGVIEPAQEVLLRFCDAEQREQWLTERRLIARGNLSGHRYLIAHRHTPTALRIGKCTFDLDDAEPMHFHDWTVPPEEEVLAAKLILEHREPWLRNEATCFGCHRERFKNPFGNGGDGVDDSFLTEDIGQAFLRRIS